MRKIIIFGSITTNKFGLGSDADILIILKNSKHERFFDRIPEFLDFFNKNVSIPVDLFIYTEEEIKLILDKNNSLVKNALSSKFIFEA
jgi:predicted nucleotidyltransferase